MPVRVERITKHCITCGTAFEVPPGKKRSAKKYCTFECSVTIRRTLPVCECVHCGTMFQPRFADRMQYCSTDCKVAFKFNINKHKSADRYAKKRLVELHCAYCNKSFTPDANEYRTYCSKQCADKMYADKAVDKLTDIKATKIYVCKICNKQFNPEYGNKIRFACSPECKTSLKRLYSHNRRARLAAAFVANVPTHMIYERDDYMCKLCNQPLNMQVPAPHPLSPSIDHIIPISKGGTHEPNNVQAAHFICNSHKGHRAFNVMKVAKYVWNPELCKIVKVKPFDYEYNGYVNPW